MEKKQIITIAGVPGSGKSSTADNVAKALGYTRFSSGDFMRKIALDRGISLNELMTTAETDASIDTSVDNEVRNTGTGSNLVIDSRLAFHWIPGSFKVFLDLPLEISKERILNNLKHNKLRQQSEGVADIDGVYKKITERLESERKRFKELYGLDRTDKSNFDLVIDTNKNNLEEVAAIILAEYKKWQTE